MLAYFFPLCILDWPANCGVGYFQPNMVGRIISGNEARPHSWPWQVSLQVQMTIKTLQRDTFCCLSSAHLWTVLILDPQILLGKHSINHAESTERFRYPHLNELDYDIALVKPVEDIVTNHFIHYACLPKRDSFLRPGHFCWVTGWGDIRGGNKNLTLSRVLNQAKLPVIDFNTCRLQKFWGDRVRQSMICAGFRDAGGPPGDSGGSLVCQTGREKWEVHGVVSFGPIGCHAENKPSVFTRTSAFISWTELRGAEETVSC
uniref:Peptidase S1 domain-containing protein n=1 Tax=Crocodylus porosus TaxID=8502 RepID=A0A7M4EWH2_CROPO